MAPKGSVEIVYGVNKDHKLYQFTSLLQGFRGLPAVPNDNLGVRGFF